MRIGVSRYEWHELFPKGIAYCFVCWCKALVSFSPCILSNYVVLSVKNNAGAIVAVWAPVILVSFF